MILTYRTEYPNQVHQLTVSVSKHYFVTKDGILKFQHKPMEVQLEKIRGSDKTHIVHYVVRDHFSGLFYSEVALSSYLIPLKEFLYRVWSRKEDYLFCGIPDLLAIPKTVEIVFPSIKQSVALLGVKFPKVTSGFQGGVRDVKTIEEDMKLAVGMPFDKAAQYVNQICRYMATRESRNGKDNKAELWNRFVKSVKLPPREWLVNT